VQRLATAEGNARAWKRLWEERGADFLRHAAGSFAVVIVDVQARTAHLGCDRFAIEPLCYAFGDGRLRFAGRADAVPGIDADTLDHQALYDYLFFHVIPAPRTIFRGVRRLPGGHAAQATTARLEVRAYWTPHFEAGRTASFAALEEQFRSLLRTAVRRQAAADTPGAFLSGGTDSSTVAGMLGEVTGAPPRTYSIGFQAEGYDEIEYARVTARHFKADHHEYYVTPQDLVDSIPAIARHYDQPFGNSSALPAYYCCRLARTDGIRRLLAGDGGDELFGGNTRYATQRIFQAYGFLPQALRRRLIEPALVGTSWPKAIPIVRKAARYVEQARIPMPDRMHTYNLLDWLGPDQVLEADFRAGVDLEEPRRQQREIYAAVDASQLNAMLAYDWKYTLADSDLPKVCGAASLAGIEVSFPLLDDDLVDFSLSLPDSYKVYGFKLRHFFKEALKGFLPDATLRKKKHGFGLPFGVWLSRHGALKELARASLHDLARRGLVRPAFVDELIGRRMEDHAKFYGEMIWILMMLEQWLSSRAPSFRVGRT